MFSRPCEEWDNPHIIALVELDMQKLRVNIALSRGAIRERLRALEHPSKTTTGNSGRPARVG
jgi:hypothetical protein